MRWCGVIALVLIAVPGCQSSPPPKPIKIPGLERARYTRTNFRVQKGNILTTAGFLSVPAILGAGTSLQINWYSLAEIRFVAGSVEYALLPYPTGTYPTEEEKIEPFLSKFFADSPEAASVEALGPPQLREKVLAGIQMVGMTKAQVYACLGHPAKVGKGVVALPLRYEDILAADTWMYPNDVILWTPIPTYVTLYFGDGLLQKQVP